MSIAALSELKIDEWDRMIDINIKGVLYGIAALLFFKNKTLDTLFISSVAGKKCLVRRYGL